MITPKVGCIILLLLYVSYAYDIEYGFVDPASYNHVFGGGAYNSRPKSISNTFSISRFACGDTVTILTKILATPSDSKSNSLVLTYAFSRVTGGLYPLLNAKVNYGLVTGGSKGPFTINPKDGFINGYDSAISDNGNSEVVSVKEANRKGSYVIDVEVSHISAQESIVLRLDMLLQCPTTTEDLNVAIVSTSSRSSIYPDQLTLSYSKTVRDCSDQIDCTLDGLVNSTCSHFSDDSLCGDNIPCTDATCSPTTGCEFTPNHTKCIASSKCVESLCDIKLGCIESPLDCNDFNECTEDSCDPSIGCVNSPISCNDNVDCTIDDCVPEIGCTFVPNHNNCDDGTGCTTNICSMSGCIYPKIPCECTEWSHRSSCRLDCDGWVIARERSCDCPSECNVPVVDTIPCTPEVRCTYNTDYWKLHPNEVISILDSVNILNTDFFLRCGDERFDYFHTWYLDVNQYPWANLAREFLSAKLNHLNGVNHVDLDNYLAEAESHFFSGSDWCNEPVPTDLYYGFLYLNEGMNGPGNCIKPACCISEVLGPCEDNERTTSRIALCTKPDLLTKWLSDCAVCGISVEEC